MQRRLLMGGGAILVLLLSCLLILILHSPVQAHGTLVLNMPAVTPTATPNMAATANAVLNQASTAEAVSDRTAQEVAGQTATTQNMLNFVSYLGIIPPVIFSAAGIILGLFGLSRLRDFEEKGKESLRQVSNAQEEIDRKREDIEKIQQKLVNDAHDTNRAISYLILGNQLTEERKHEQARETLNKALRLRPDDPQINYALGRVYNATGAYQEAIKYFEKALAADSELPQAHGNLGMAYRDYADQCYQKTQDEEARYREYHRAIEHLKRAHELLPGYEVVTSSLAGTYRRLKMYKAALRYYRLTLEIDPESSYAAGNIGLLEYHEGNIEAARSAFKLTRELAAQFKSPDGRYWDFYDLGMSTLILQKGKHEAIGYYKDALEETPGSQEISRVLNGLALLQEVEDKYPVDGLDVVIKILEQARGEMEAKERVREETKARIIKEMAEEEELKEQTVQEGESEGVA